jgi:hypothetical protein
MRARVELSPKQRAMRDSLLAAITIGIVGIAAQPTAGAQQSPAISQGFTSAKDVTASSLVSLRANTANEVELSEAAKADRLLGVVGNKPLIELTDERNEVQVVTSGLTATLVSDINGVVKSGDKITASPIRGVGMRATQNAVVVGTAQLDLNTAKATKRMLSDIHGKHHTVAIGVVPVQIHVTYYSPKSDTSSLIPPFLQAIANRISGNYVSPMRVLLAAVMFLFLFVSVSILLYSAVHSSITSIGRNPLSESAVRKSLRQVGLTVAGVSLFMVLAIYLVLIL